MCTISNVTDLKITIVMHRIKTDLAPSLPPKIYAHDRVLDFFAHRAVSNTVSEIESLFIEIT